MQTQKAQKRSGNRRPNVSGKMDAAPRLGHGSFGPGVRRRDSFEHQADEAAQRIMRGETGVATMLSPAPAASFRVSTSLGEPLARDVREDIEKGFGADLGAVRIHRDAPAAAAVKAEEAQAFASGRDIYFSSGAFNPSSEPGRRLLLHETAHVLQQTARIQSDSRPHARDVIGSGSAQFDKRKPPDLTQPEQALEEEIATLDKGPIEDLLLKIETAHYGSSVLIPFSAPYQPEDAVWSVVERLYDFEGKRQIDVDAQMKELEIEALGGKYKSESIEFQSYLCDLLKVKQRFRGAAAMLRNSIDIRTAFFSPRFRRYIVTSEFCGITWLEPILKSNESLKVYWPKRYLDRIWHYLSIPSLTAAVIGDAVKKVRAGNANAYKGSYSHTTLGTNELILCSWDLVLYLYEQLQKLLLRLDSDLRDLTPANRKKLAAEGFKIYAKHLTTSTWWSNSEKFLKDLSNEINGRAVQAGEFWSRALKLDKEFLEQNGNPFTLERGEHNYEKDFVAYATDVLRVKDKWIPGPREYRTSVKAFRTYLKKKQKDIESILWKQHTYSETKKEAKQSTKGETKEETAEGPSNLLVALGGFLYLTQLVVKQLDSYSYTEDVAQEKKYATDDVRHAHRIGLAEHLHRMADLLGWKDLVKLTLDVRRAVGLPNSVLAIPNAWKVDIKWTERTRALEALLNDFSPDAPLREWEPLTAGHIVTFFVTKYYSKIIEKVSERLSGDRPVPSEVIAKALLEDLNTVREGEAGPRSRIDEAIGELKERLGPVRMKSPGAKVATQSTREDLIHLMETHAKVKELLSDQEALKALNIDIKDFFVLYPVGFERGVYLWLIPFKEEIKAGLSDLMYEAAIARSSGFYADSDAKQITAGSVTKRLGEKFDYYRYTYTITSIEESFQYIPAQGSRAAAAEAASAESEGPKTETEEATTTKEKEGARGGTVLSLGGGDIPDNSPLLLLTKTLRGGRSPVIAERKISEDVTICKGDQTELADLSRALDLQKFKPIVEEASQRLAWEQLGELLAARGSIHNANIYQRLFISAGRIRPLLESYDLSDPGTLFNPIEALRAIKEFESTVKPEKDSAPGSAGGLEEATQNETFVLKTRDEYELQMAALMLEIAEYLYEALETTSRYDVVTGYLDYLKMAIDIVSRGGYARERFLPYLDINASQITYDKDAKPGKRFTFEKGKVDVSWIGGQLLRLITLKNNFEEVAKEVQADYGFAASTDDEGTLRSLTFHSVIKVSEEPDNKAGESEPGSKKDVEEGKGLLDVEQVTGRYQFLAVHTDFVFHPHYGDVGSAAYLEPKVLKEEGSDDRVEAGAHLLTVKMGTQRKEISNKPDQYYLLEDICQDINRRGFEQAMKNLEVIIRAWAEVMGDLLECTPFGPAVIATRLTAEIADAFTSEQSPYQVLKKLLEEGISEKVDEFKQVLSADNLIIFALFGHPWLEKFLKSGGREKKTSEDKVRGGRKKTFAKLKELGRKTGRSIRSGLEGLKKAQGQMRVFQTFASTRPIIAAAIEFAADHIFELSRLPDLVKDKEEGLLDMVKDPAANINRQLDDLESQITEFSKSLRGFELPKDNVIDIKPLVSGMVSVLMEFVATRLGKRIKAKGVPVGKIAPLIVDLMRETGALRLISDRVASEIVSVVGDPNDVWRGKIAPKIEEDFNLGRAQLADYLMTIHRAIEGLREPQSVTETQIPKAKSEPEAAPFVSDIEVFNPEARIEAPSSGGRPLPQSRLRDVNSRFGHDLSHVRIHDDTASHSMVEAAGAEALTSGSHIYLSRGVRTDYGTGRHILDHELVHVLQQTGARPAGKTHDSRPVEGRKGRGVVYDSTKESAVERVTGVVGEQSVAEEPIELPDLGDTGFYPYVDLLTVHRILRHVVDLSSIKNRQKELDRRRGEAGKTSSNFVNDMVEDLAVVLTNINKTAHRKKVSFAKTFESRDVRAQIQKRLRWGKDLEESEQQVLNAAYRIAKPEIKRKRGSDGKKKHFDDRSFLRRFEGHVLARSGIAISVSLSQLANKRYRKDWPGKLKQVRVLHIHLPFVHGGSQIWDEVIEETWFSSTGGPALEPLRKFTLDTSGITDSEAKQEAEELNKAREDNRRNLMGRGKEEFKKIVRPAIKAHLGSRSLSPIIWKRTRNGKLKLRDGTKTEIERFMIEPKGGALLPSELPAISEYVKTGRDPRHPEKPAPAPATVIRVDLNSHAEQKKMSAKGRESHHLTQYLLAQYFSNKITDEAKRPFPDNWACPGVEKADGRVKSFSASGEKKLRLLEMEQGRGGIMPAILLSALTHRTGDLHVTTEPDDIAGTSKQVQSNFVHNAFFQNMPGRLADAMQAADREAMTQYINQSSEKEVEIKIHGAMMATYERMRDYMMGQLRSRMPEKESEYYVNIREQGMRKPGQDEEKLKAELEEVKKNLKPELEDVADQAKKYNSIVMEELGWK